MSLNVEPSLHSLVSGPAVAEASIIKTKGARLTKLHTSARLRINPSLFLQEYPWLSTGSTIF